MRKEKDLKDIDLNEDFEFFGENMEKEDVSVFEEEKSEESEESKKPEETKKSEDPEEEVVFENFESPTEDETKDKEDAVGKLDSTTEAIKTIFDQGYLELQEGEKITEENAEELFRGKFQNAVSQEVATIFENFPEEVKNVISYVTKGGDIKDYLTLSKEGEITEGMDMSNEANQKTFLKTKFEKDGYTKDEVEAEIKRLSENGKLGDIASLHYSKWENKIKKEKEQSLLKAEQAEQEKKEALKKSKEEYSEYLKTVDFKDITITEKDKKELPNYILEPKYRLNNGTIISEYQKAIYDVMQDKEKNIILAKILQSGVDLKKIKALVETEVVDKFKKNIQRNKLPDSRQKNNKQEIYNPLEYF